MWRRALKNETLFTVARDNPYAKIDSFVQAMPELLEALMSSPRLKRLAIVRIGPSLMRYSLVVTLLVNALILVAHSKFVETLPWPFNWLPGALLIPVGLLHALLAVARLVSYCTITIPDILEVSRAAACAAVVWWWGYVVF